jgi:3-deoxy-D-manno-octulosonate 8-phosphate phosphatase (KDO 8-P phosphatase)
MNITCPFRHVVTDVDGVLTDGSFHYSPDGKTHKVFGPHDSDGVKIFRRLGIAVYAISADKRGFPITLARMNDMNVPIEYVTENNRYRFVADKFVLGDTCFIGDGIFDAALLADCSFSFSPSNAPDFVRQYAKHNCKARGGNGVLLEAALYTISTWFPNELDALLKDLRLL